jgi:hypothetical protein
MVNPRAPGAVVENHLAREWLFRREINCFFALFAIVQFRNEPPSLPREATP